MENFQKNHKLNVPQYLSLTMIILGFVTGLFDHAFIIWTRGFLVTRPEMPIIFNLFWDSLFIADLLAIILLLKNINTGLTFASAIMVADVIVNSIAAGIDYYLQREFVMRGLYTQIPFMVFVLYFKRSLKKNPAGKSEKDLS